MAEFEGSFKVVIDVPDLTGVRDVIVDAHREAALAVAENLLSDSRLYVPVLSGDLLDSGRVEVTGALFDSVVVSVIYGSGSADYAETQHDDPYRHPSLSSGDLPFAAEYLTKPLEFNRTFYITLYEFVINAKLRQAGLT